MCPKGLSSSMLGKPQMEKLTELVAWPCKPHTHKSPFFLSPGSHEEARNHFFAKWLTLTIVALTAYEAFTNARDSSKHYTNYLSFLNLSYSLLISEDWFIPFWEG